jgi:hypothetical protein
MRFLLLACLVALCACKKHPQPTLPQIPDSSPMAGGGNNELPQATVFHTMYRYTGHSQAVFAFYGAELEKRGARRVGETYVDDNLDHSGGFGSNGSAAPKDPTKPGVWLGVQEVQDATYVDLWESVPKPE